MDELRILIEENVLNKDIEVELISEGIDCYVGEITLQDFDITNYLLREGFAKLSLESLNEDSSIEKFKKYQESLFFAQRKHIRIWRDYKSSKNSFRENFTFKAIVVEIHTGDCFTVKDKESNEFYRYFLSNVIAPKIEKPGYYNSKEFLRSLTIGNKIIIKIIIVLKKRERSCC